MRLMSKTETTTRRQAEGRIKSAAFSATLEFGSEQALAMLDRVATAIRSRMEQLGESRRKMERTE